MEKKKKKKKKKIDRTSESNYLYDTVGGFYETAYNYCK